MIKKGNVVCGGYPEEKSSMLLNEGPLASFCFSFLIETIQRCRHTHEEHIENPPYRCKNCQC